jgi:hypothetical protein
MYKYDSNNRILQIDSLDSCNKEAISAWIDSNIADVLGGETSRNYITSKLEVRVDIVCNGYLVAHYFITDGEEDRFIINQLGYTKAR